MHTTAAAIYQAIKKSTDDKPRPHLGASQIGHRCERYLWLSFRWASREDFDGRMLRLFWRGHEEEKYVVADLRSAGMVVEEIDTATGRQFSFSHGHFSGSGDGIIRSGVPESPNKPHVLEIKTHSVKSFADMAKNGVEKSKPLHYAQMQVYMRQFGIDRALYLAVCKDNDQIHAERVKLDSDMADKLAEKAHRIIMSDRMPEPMTTDATWYECKFCHASYICRGRQPAREVNCRTCAKSTATADGKWHCAEWDDTIPTHAQYKGCQHHVIHPDLMPYQHKLTDDGRTLIYIVNGQEIANGAKELGATESRELLDRI